MSNQVKVTENQNFEFKESGQNNDPILRSFSEADSSIQCTRSLCSKPNLYVYKVMTKMIETNNSTGCLQCSGFEDGIRPCGGFFEVSAILS